MCRLYSFLQMLARGWIWFGAGLIAAVFTFGLIGFARTQPENTTLTNAYLVMLMFAMNCNDVSRNVGWELEWARWLGFLVWSFAVGAILIRLFSQRMLYVFLAVSAWFRGGHVVVAGLGEPESERDRLVERLRTDRKDVVVVEPRADHPGLEACRQAGAICLIGSPYEPNMLQRARISRAGTLLALCDDDRKNISLLSLAAALLKGQPALVDSEEEDPFTPSKPDNVGCVIQVSEPRLMEVLQRHDLNRNAADRLHLRIFNMHEMVARAMLRESLIGPDAPVLKKVLLLGLGAEGRFGESLVVRAAKDRWIEGNGNPQPLEIHVHDQAATEWVESIRSGFGIELAQCCRLVPADRPASGLRFRSAEQREELINAEYDAVFVCLARESHALIQASQLREALPPSVPIIVSVHEESAGFGRLLNEKNAGGLGPNIHVVGTHDRVFDIVASMNPAVEILAQVLHQDYLLLTQQKLQSAKDRGDEETARRIGARAAFKPWSLLAEEYRHSNRALARRLHAHLTVPAIGGRPPRRFRIVFAPQGAITPANAFKLLDDEITTLAMQEHRLWMDEMIHQGWSLDQGKDPFNSDPDRKVNPNLVVWKELDPGMQDYDRNIIRRLPFIFAKADYRLEELAGEQPKSVPAGIG